MISISKWLLSFSLLFLSACSVTPTTITKQPDETRPHMMAKSTPNTGAIYNGNGFRPLFEDRRPRYVGDIVTVNIVENTSATKATGSATNKSSSADASITSIFGKALPTADFSGSSDLSYQDDAAGNASNNFNGAITATVTEVLPNGFLVVSGEKQIGLDKGTEFVRFSGVVNPDNITIGNFVTSTRIADARIEYRTNSKIDTAEIITRFARFFLSMGL